MRRREFIILLAGAAATWPRVVRAQQGTKIPRIGVLSPSRSEDASPNRVMLNAFVAGLRELGYVDGQNIIIERRLSEANTDRLREAAADFVRHNVDVIVTLSTTAARPAKQATSVIPIVAIGMADPVDDELVASLARPGGNVTGATFFSNLLSAKRLDLFHRLVPGAVVMAVLLNPNNANVELERSQTEEAALALGLQLISLEATNEREINEAVGNLTRQRVAALIISGDVIFYSQRQLIAELALRHDIPTSCPFRDQVVAGCLMSYGANPSVTQRQAGNYVGRILKGEKPADLPVQQPTKFELVINLKTAKALGIEVPNALLLVADGVIE